MIYELKYEARAVKQIKKLDPAARKLIKTWIEKNLFEYAIHLLFESDNRECLKFGLSLLELFKTNDKSGSYRHRQYAPQLYGICERCSSKAEEQTFNEA